MKINEYSAYFYPEVKEFLNKDELEEMMKIIPSNFEELRQKGETDSFIIDFIRKDSIDDFIVYVNKTNCSLSSEIKPSILETNSFLIKKNKDLTLIEYAAFFGSFQIFKYLLSNDIELKPELWIYAIRGRNPEIINVLEEKNIKPEGKMNLVYKDYYLEAIKCHHNEIANYVFQNIQNKNFSDFINSCAFENYNFEFIDNSNAIKTYFYNLCNSDYVYLVKLLYTSPKIQINALKKIYNLIFNKIFF